MIAIESRHFRWPVVLGGVLAACLLPCAYVSAQEGDSGYRTGEKGRVEIDGNGHRIGPSDPVTLTPPGRGGIETDADRAISADPTKGSPANDSGNTGPIRLARFAFVSGSVNWRADSSDEWSKATINLPIRQGAQIWIQDGGRADVQFDDGSELRLGNGALATLKVLYSDKEGEFTQIALYDGLATLRSRHDNAVYQVDTPAASVKSKGASQIRFGIDNGTEISVQRGDATIEGPQGKTSLHSGDYLDLPDSDASFKVRPAPQADAWDRWNDERNRLLEGAPSKHVPSNIGLVSGELDSYGAWRSDPAYGSVWYPRGVSSDWRPYYDGRWTYCDPFGWTWVSSEPWGWAPYHYGTWIHASYGWGWCPGPLHQYWSPAVVHFSVYDGNVAWAPLCPSEVRYPSAFSFGYWGSSWAFSFSIGSCGVYYPSGGYCFGRPWNNHFVNFYGYGDRSFNNHNFNDFNRGGGSPTFNRFGRTNEFAAANSHFVPFNSRHGNGASFARLDSFGGQGRYQTLAATNTSFFARGRYAAPPGAGQSPVAGPPAVAPTALSRTPTRSFITGTNPSQAAMQRNLYHAAPPITGGSASRTGIGGANRTSAAGSSNVIGSRANPSGASGTQTPRGRTPTDPYRAGVDAGRTARQPSQGIGNADVGRSTGQPTQGIGNADAGSLGSRQTPLSGSGVRPNSSQISAAEAARSARSSLGYIYGGAGSDRAARGTGSNSGTTSGATSGDRYGNSGRVPRFGGATTDQGGTANSGGRGSDYSYRSRQPQTSSGTGAGSSRTYDGSERGTYRTPGGVSGGSTSSGSSGDYRSGRSRSYGGDYTTPRTGSSGDYTPGRSTGGSGGYAPNRSGSTGGYNPDRSGSSGGTSSGGNSGGRSGGSGGGNSGGRSSGSSSDSGNSGGRSSGDSSGGGYSSGRSRR